MNRTAVINALTCFEEAFGPHLTVRHLRILAMLDLAPWPLQLREIASSLGIPKASAGRLVAGLIEANLAFRVRSGTDRRDTPVKLTAAGASLVGMLQRTPRTFAAQATDIRPAA
jgi:DNA-binding MarR family transcriptional regulator